MPERQRQWHPRARRALPLSVGLWDETAYLSAAAGVPLEYRLSRR